MEIFAASILLPICDDTHSYVRQFHIFFTALLHYRGFWGHLGLPKFRMFLNYSDIYD